MNVVDGGVLSTMMSFGETVWMLSEWAVGRSSSNNPKSVLRSKSAEPKMESVGASGDTVKSARSISVASKSFPELGSVNMEEASKSGGISYLLIEWIQLSCYCAYFPCCKQKRGEPEASFEADREKQRRLGQRLNKTG